MAGQFSRKSLAAWTASVARIVTLQACLAPELIIWKFNLKSAVP